MQIQVFSAPSCVACNTTKMFLRKAELRYIEIDVTQDESALDKCKNMGFTELPVVVAGDHAWSGFRYDNLHALKAEILG